MRFQVHVVIGGNALANDETGTGELARIMQTVGFAILNDRLSQVGDNATLYDINGHPVGAAHMIPDWAPGEEVWVTTDEGVHLKSVIEEVQDELFGPHVAIRCRYIASHEMLTTVTVDHLGHDQLGRPVLARVPS